MGSQPAGKRRIRALARSAACVASVGAALLLGGVALGQGAAADKAAASALFDEALHLMKGGEFSAACPKLEESQRLDPAVGTLLYLGECYEQQGLVASAWTTFTSAQELAHAQKQPSREQTARQRADALAAKVPKLTINVAPEARVAGLEVLRDGAPVGEAMYGLGMPVDPGEHTVTANARGKKTWSQTIRVEKLGTTVVNLPLLPDDLSSPGPGPVKPKAPTAPTEAHAASGTGTPQLVAGSVVLGVGVVGIVIGAVFGAKAKGKESDSEAYCRPEDPTRCAQQGLDLLDDGHSAATIANVAFVAGGLLAAGGVVLLLTAPTDEEPSTPAGAQQSGPADRAKAQERRFAAPRMRVELAPAAGQTAAGLTLRGAW